MHVKQVMVEDVFSHLFMVTKHTPNALKRAFICLGVLLQLTKMDIIKEVGIMHGVLVVVVLRKKAKRSYSN